MDVSEESVRSMTDDELRAALCLYRDPETVGPINGMTRKIYEKVLLQHAGVVEKEEPDDSSTVKEESPDTEFVDQYEPMETDEPDAESVAPQKSFEPEVVRHRVAPAKDAFSTAGDAPRVRPPPSMQNVAPTEGSGLPPLQALLFAVVAIGLAYVVIIVRRVVRREYRNPGVMADARAMGHGVQLLKEARRLASMLDFSGAKARCDAAIAALKGPAVKAGPNTDESRKLAALFNERGLAVYKLVDFVEASDNFSEAIRWDSKLPFPYYHRGIVSFRMGRFAEAVLDMERALSLVQDPAARSEFSRGLEEARKQARNGVAGGCEEVHGR